ncbi:MAG TPA: peroxidase, partial [Xanthomonadaceae bacterium]|nr:peroxidase [Xanthomonadaceae bacterium]
MPAAIFIVGTLGHDAASHAKARAWCAGVAGLVRAV